MPSKSSSVSTRGRASGIDFARAGGGTQIYNLYGVQNGCSRIPPVHIVGKGADAGYYNPESCKGANRRRVFHRIVFFDVLYVLSLTSKLDLVVSPNIAPPFSKGATASVGHLPLLVIKVQRTSGHHASLVMA